MRRLRNERDTRPRWNDPDLPGLPIRDPVTGEMVYTTAEQTQRMAQILLDLESPSMPHWRDDPTYDMRRKRV